ncbi:hypothetical protein STEG23_022474 [Scotinomys teguina]
MPNEDIDMSNLDLLEKYRSFERYHRWAEQKARAPHWWWTYREHFVKETDPKDKIDIGLPRVIRIQQLQDQKHFIRELRANREEERAARLRTASISLEAVRAEWERTCGPYHKQRLAEYYGLYQDLFHGATSVPRVSLQVALIPVYYGNEVTPTEASQAPEQDKPIDFSEDTRPSPCYQLAQRTLRTFDFYKKHQEAMTRAGLAFFQCLWDDSVTHTFHRLLDMREPVFEFVRPPPYHPKQKRFPHQQPLRYLDLYRDSHDPTYGIY